MTTRWILLTIANGIIGGFVCAFVTLTLIFLTTATPGQHFTFNQYLEATVQDAVFYGVPIGVVCFVVSALLSKRRVDLNRFLLYLYPGTIAGGFVVVILSNNIFLGLAGAVTGYILALLFILIFPPKRRERITQE